MVGKELAVGRGVEVEDDVDQIDYNNYKGMYFGDDDRDKYTCPDTGAHFEYYDMCRRISRVLKKRNEYEEQ